MSLPPKRKVTANEAPISLALTLLCILSLAGCKHSETVKVEYDEAELYTAGDIGLTMTCISPATETVKILVENGSEYELSYGQPFLTFSRKTLFGWKCIEPNPNWAYTLEGYTLAPGESVELEASTERYLVGLLDGKNYRACFEFWYSAENPEADENGNFQPIMHNTYLVCDFKLPDVVE